MNDNKIIVDKLTCVYSYYDILPPNNYNFGGYWNVIYVNEESKLEKIYKHIITADEIVYYCTKYSVQCKVNTKKFGWCLLNVHPGLNFTKFGIYKSNTRYDIQYAATLMCYLPLYGLLLDFLVDRISEYNKDINL